jgi:hypothetical protein
MMEENDKQNQDAICMYCKGKLSLSLSLITFNKSSGYSVSCMTDTMKNAWEQVRMTSYAITVYREKLY